MTFCSEGLDEVVDFGFRANVDASRRFVEQQNARARLPATVR